METCSQSSSCALNEPPSAGKEFSRRTSLFEKQKTAQQADQHTLLAQKLQLFNT
jgi:hypothetical protein